MSKHPMTEQGAEKLRAELEERKRVKRPAIVAAIAEARAHGDLKENAEYHAAREQQSFNEGRILEIEAKLSLAQVIDVSKFPQDEKVIFGATVHLTNVETEQEVVYQIVGEDESDLKEHKISYSSPIARAMIGKFVGDAVEVNAPSGLIEYEIDQVEYV